MVNISLVIIALLIRLHCINRYWNCYQLIFWLSFYDRNRLLKVSFCSNLNLDFLVFFFLLLKEI